MMSSIEYSFESIDLDAVFAMLERTYWSERIRRDVVECAFKNSLWVSAFDGERQIGVARVVTDKATFAWLCDVFVLETHRGRGIAKSMVERLMQIEDLATVRRWMLATRDAHDVYRPLGYTEVEPGRVMAKLAPTSVWQRS